MKVKCINNECISGDLELGKIYNVVEEVRNYYAIEVKQGVVVHFRKDMFKIIKEQSNINILPKENIKRLQKKVAEYELRNRGLSSGVYDTIEVLRGDAVEISMCIPTLKAIGIDTRIIESHITNLAILGIESIREKWNYRIEDGIIYYCNKSGSRKKYDWIVYSETNLSTFLELDIISIEERISREVIASILQEEIDKTCENMEDSCNFEKESTEYVRCMEMLKKRCLEEKHEHSKKNDKILDRLKSKFGSSIK